MNDDGGGEKKVLYAAVEVLHDPQVRRRGGGLRGWRGRLSGVFFSRVYLFSLLSLFSFFSLSFPLPSLPFSSLLLFSPPFS